MQLQLFGRQPNFEVGLIRSEQLCWMDFESLSFVRIPLLMQTSWIVLFETSRKKRTEIRKLVIFLLIATLYIIICLIGFDPIWKKNVINKICYEQHSQIQILFLECIFQLSVFATIMTFSRSRYDFHWFWEWHSSTFVQLIKKKEVNYNNSVFLF